MGHSKLSLGGEHQPGCPANWCEKEKKWWFASS